MSIIHYTKKDIGWVFVLGYFLTPFEPLYSSPLKM